MAKLSLLLAPPAWGKTTLLLELFERNSGLWVYISPLRALADEFFQRVRGRLKTCYLQGRGDLAQLLKRPPPRVVVATPETLGEAGASWAASQGAQFVFDEIHLFYMWGDGFRPWLREYLYIVGNTNQNILGLTATLSDHYLERCRADFGQAGYDVCVEDWGNFRWGRPPKRLRYYGFRGRVRLRRNFLRGLRSDKRSLLFCQTRREVANWVDFCRRHKFSVIGCVGGEVAPFKKRLRDCPDPLAIVCTSVLSHGVNLPSFDAVYLDLVVDNAALWLQMAARGGRRGEDFTLHCLNWPLSTRAQKCGRWAATLLSDEVCQWIL